MWRVNADTTPAITVACGCRDARVRQWDGKLLAILQPEETTGTLTIKLDYIGMPLYIEWGADRAQDGQFFPATGHYIARPFLQYWQDHGGLRQFGHPISGALIEPESGSGKPRLVQYFERNRLELVPEAGNTTEKVELGRLGEDFLHTMGVDWKTLPRPSDTPPECRVFPETGHRICPPFRDYWERFGGADLFGMPLTEAYDENGMLVQYFERNRFERHADKAGTPFEIQLSPLGRTLYGRGNTWP